MINYHILTPFLFLNSCMLPGAHVLDGNVRTDNLNLLPIPQKRATFAIHAICCNSGVRKWQILQVLHVSRVRP